MGELTETKSCSVCGEVKALSEFGKKGKPHPEGSLRARCKTCEGLYWKEYYSKHKRKLNLKTMLWQAKNFEKEKARHSKRNRGDSRNKDLERERKRKRRALQSVNHFTQSQWRDLQAKYDYLCLKCGQRKPLHADHVIPLSKGGADTIDNIQPLCAECNLSKGVGMTDYRVNIHPRVSQASLFDREP